MADISSWPVPPVPPVLLYGYTASTQDLIARLENFVASLRRQPNDQIEPQIILQIRLFIASIETYESKTSHESPFRSKANAHSVTTPTFSDIWDLMFHTNQPQEAHQQPNEILDTTLFQTGQSNHRAPGSQRQVAEAADALQSLQSGDRQNSWLVGNGDAPDQMSFPIESIQPVSASASRNQEPSFTRSTAHNMKRLQRPSSPQEAPQNRCRRACGKECIEMSLLDCPECTKRSGPSGKKKPHCCPDCPQSYTRAATLKEHLRVHSKEKPYKCGTCSKAFTRIKDCKRHERVHSGKEYRCSMSSWKGNDDDNGCGGLFGRKDSLMAHFDTKIGARCAEKYVSFFRSNLGALFFGNETVCTFADSDFPGCGREFKNIDELLEHLGAPLKQHCMKDRVLKFVDIL
ncbi:hypothetical protein ACMFMG_007864 [Clarireedia jacksonii]